MSAGATRGFLGRAMVLQWFEAFQELPTAEDFVRDFGASRSTYYQFNESGVPALWEEHQYKNTSVS